MHGATGPPWPNDLQSLATVTVVINGNGAKAEAMMHAVNRLQILTYLDGMPMAAPSLGAAVCTPRQCMACSVAEAAPHGADDKASESNNVIVESLASTRRLAS